MFWSKFSQLCLENETSASQVVKVLNIAAGSVTKWKNGAIPSSKSLQKIAEYFDVSTDYLLGETKADKKLYMAACDSFLTRDERRILTVYKLLDDNGKKAVFDLLKKEYDRIKRADGLIPSTVAARSADGEETVHSEYLPDLSEIPADDTDL